MPAKGATVSGLDLDAAHAGLRLVDGFAGIAREDLRPMSVKGLFHDHVRVAGTRWLLRLPRASQFELSPADNLDYQAACFAHAAPSGCTPSLAGRIEPRPGLPWGGLVVAAVDGGPARLPGDLASMAACLAGIHALKLPPEGERRPLAIHADPIAGILGFIEPQSLYFDRASMSAPARAQIAEELAWARGYAVRHAGARQPISLCATDTHPGNFLVERERGGRARSSSTWRRRSTARPPSTWPMPASTPRRCGTPTAPRRSRMTTCGASMPPISTPSRPASRRRSGRG